MPDRTKIAQTGHFIRYFLTPLCLEELGSVRKFGIKVLNLNKVYRFRLIYSEEVVKEMFV